MFDYKHYVSVLRWKAAEKEALGGISAKEKAYVTPLIELVMPQPLEYKINEKGVERAKISEELLNESIKKFNDRLPVIPKEILKFWGNSPLFIDLSLIDFSVRTRGLKNILLTSAELGLSLIPVVRLSSDASLLSEASLYAKKDKSGVCLILYRSDFKESSLSSRINDFFSKTSLSESETDLVVDLQITDSKCLLIKEFIDCIPNILEWRTFTVISGTFPDSLMKFTVDLHRIDRSDWIYWLNQINSGSLSRKPSFGDYTIQHPIYAEPAPGSNPSASIRYTIPNKWMIMRGQGLRSKNSAGFAQYPALAQLLKEQPEFYGEKFSEGDAYIASIGSDILTKKTGNPRTWLRAGINHHIACVVSEISKLT